MSETNRIENSALREAKGAQIKAEKRVAELERENAELRERMEELNKALAKLENYLEVTATYAPSRPKRDYAQFVLETLRADLSQASAKPKPEEENGK